MERRGWHKWRAAQAKYLSASNKAKRKDFALERLHWRRKWRAVRFTDEVHVALDQLSTEFLLRRPGERQHEDCLQWKKKRKDPYFHIWAAIGWNYKSELVFYGEGKGMGNITMERYLDEVFCPYILPEWEEACMNGDSWILEEDNDGGHGTRSKDNIVQRLRNCMESYANPPRSPDLAPIENVWRILKQRVKQHRPRTLADLKYWLIIEWEAITYEEINRLIDSMPQRIRQCVERNGGSTSF